MISCQRNPTEHAGLTGVALMLTGISPPSEAQSAAFRLETHFPPAEPRDAGELRLQHFCFLQLYIALLNTDKNCLLCKKYVAVMILDLEIFIHV